MSAQTSSATTVKSPGYAWAILGIVYLLSVTAAMLWFSAPPMAQDIIGAYIVQLGPESINANFGMLMTDIAIGAIISAIVGTVLQNKIGVKWLLLLSAAFLVIGAAMSWLSGTDYTMLTIARIIAGLGIGFVAVSATTAVAMWFYDDKRAMAMALWGTWVPVSMLIEYNIIVPLCAGTGDFHNTWMVITVMAIISLVLVVFFYRQPPSGGQISTEKTKLSEGFKWIGKRQVIALVLCMFLYNFVSHGFNTFNPSFFTDPVDAGGLGWDTGFANFIVSITSAAGIIAPVFGIIFDRLPFKKRYILLVIGGAAYILACVFGFKNLGALIFVLYVICAIFANGMMVACIRSMMPSLVGRGGVTAVTVGLALVTLFEFGGQMFTNFYGMAMDALGYATASLAVGVPASCLLVICAFLVKPDKELIEANEHAHPAAE